MSDDGPIERALLAGLAAAGVRAAAKAEPTTPPRETWRTWSGQIPRKRTTDGWVTDDDAWIEDLDPAHIMAETGWAKRAFEILGYGDPKAGERRFSAWNERQLAREKAQALEAARTTGVTQSVYESPGMKEKLLRAERRTQLEATRERLTAEIAALEIEPTPPAE